MVQRAVGDTGNECSRKTKHGVTPSRELRYLQLREQPAKMLSGKTRPGPAWAR